MVRLIIDQLKLHKKGLMQGLFSRVIADPFRNPPRQYRP
jgi:hypothetical protein